MNLNIEQLKRIIKWHYVFSGELSTDEVDDELLNVLAKQLEQQIEEAPREVKLKEYLTNRFVHIDNDFECSYCKKSIYQCECEELSLDEFELLTNKK